MKYATIWLRLVANSEPESDNEQACWLFTGRKRSQWGYGRTNLYVPGLKTEVALLTHLVAWLLHQEHVERNADGVYLAYQELRCSGLTLDHLCVQTLCLRPDHLEPETMLDNIKLRDERRRRDAANQQRRQEGAAGQPV